MQKILTIILLFAMKNVVAQQKPAYVLYNVQGKKTGYKKMISTLTKQDVVLIGEFHANPISHWLQLEITKDCKEKRNLVLGAEMFEQDNQQALNNYVQGKITQQVFDTSARLWPNYATDYAPLVNFAKDNKLSFAATNIPRRYAALVAKKGFTALDSLSALEKTWMAPLPMAFNSTLPGYVNMKKMMGDHGSNNIVKAQASKDATMAHFILQYFVPGNLFIHYNGSYHSDNHDGIYWYLKQQKPDLKIATIATVSQADVKKLLKENKGKADYIICVDEDMTSTY